MTERKPQDDGGNDALNRRRPTFTSKIVYQTLVGRATKFRTDAQANNTAFRVFRGLRRPVVPVVSVVVSVAVSVLEGAFRDGAFQNEYARIRHGGDDVSQVRIRVEQ